MNSARDCTAGEAKGAAHFLDGPFLTELSVYSVIGHFP
jgi:hypothetical protein